MKENEGKKKEFTEGKIFEVIPQDTWDELTRDVERRVVAPSLLSSDKGTLGIGFTLSAQGK